LIVFFPFYQTLEKLSWEHPTALLRAGAVAAIFTFLDFFDIGVQRTGMSTIANICRQVPSDQLHLFTDVLGQLTDMLQYPDQKSTRSPPAFLFFHFHFFLNGLGVDTIVAESACLSFCRMIENFVGDEQRVETIVSRGLLPRVTKLIAGEGSVTLEYRFPYFHIFI
jgi:E3 ubiquitin-protein ligase TRIP12